jgi:hypothetical protein
MDASILSQFREQLYTLLHLYNGSDSELDLIDALSCAQGERSVVELSLQPAFRRRHYSGLYKAIRHFPLTAREIMPLLAGYLSFPQRRPFRLLAVDTLPHPRPYAVCLQDRGFIYAPNPTPGQKPLAVGHVYSLLAFLPESEGETTPPWAVFLDARRVATRRNAAQVAQEQVSQWLRVQAQATPSVSADQALTAGDSRYSTPEFIYPLAVEAGTNVLIRLRSNRVLFGPPPVERASRRGHPRWYGQRLALNDPTTWPQADVEESWTVTERRGLTLVYHLQAWREMRMRGKREWPMQRCPFTLMRVWVTTPQGEMVYPRPLWLALFGPRRNDEPLRTVVEGYLQRSHQEHGHRFLKQNLLATAYQTPEVANEEQWWRILVLAHFQLWLARKMSQPTLRPWERYLPRWREGDQEKAPLPPSQVQRVLARIIGQMGSPARRLQPRGKSHGREPGKRLPPRTRHEIVRKGVSHSRQAASQPT